MFKDKIKPPMVLTIICVVCCCLLVLAYELTYVDNAGVITDELRQAYEDIYGSADDIKILLNDDETVYQPNGVISVIADNNGNRAYEIIADGYEKGGIHVLVGLDENSEVKGISFIAIGETPGLGTKITNDEFLSQFYGFTADQLPLETSPQKQPRSIAVWGTREEIDELKAELLAQSNDNSDLFDFDIITGATYSSKGLYSAVETALNADTIYNIERSE